MAVLQTRGRVARRPQDPPGAPHRPSPHERMSSALTLPGWRSQLLDFWERPETKKARRVAFHVARATKKFLFGTGNAAWVMGSTVLVMVMPLVLEMDREQQGAEWEASMEGVPPKL